MPEFRRTNEQLTTADFAGRAERISNRTAVDEETHENVEAEYLDAPRPTAASFSNKDAVRDAEVVPEPMAASPQLAIGKFIYFVHSFNLFFIRQKTMEQEV